MRVMHGTVKKRPGPLAMAGALVLAAAAAVLPSAPAAAAEDDPVPVVSSTFEDGTTQGWSPRGGETVAASDAVAHGGSGSLAVTDRTGTWQGPVLPVTDLFTPGTAYTVTVWMRLADGAAADTARLSLERRLDGTPSYHTLASAEAAADGWVELTGTYTPATEADQLTVYVETAARTDAFFIDDAVISYTPETPIQDGIPSLRDVFPHAPVGAAVSPAELYGERAALLSKHYTSLTPGNALKWDATEPSEGEFRFTDADPIIGFAQDHGMAVRGHTLVWHNQTPSWVFQDADDEPMTPTPGNKALLLDRLETHIRGVMGRYGDAIDTWDVVNEVIDPAQPDGLRRSPWYEIAGLDYIRTAFRVAHEVDPDATLVINDYNTNVPAKRDALYDVVSGLLDEGVPVHGVGHQMHVNVEWPSAGETGAMLEKFAPLGLEQQITEMDVSIYTSGDESFPSPPEERLLAQAHKYREMFDLFARYAEQGEVTSVTLWGLSDDTTWLDRPDRDDAPLLFDDDLQAKPAYWALADPGWDGEPGASSGCTVDYRVVDQWAGEFRAEVTVTNTAQQPVEGWALNWSFPEGPGIGVEGTWNGTADQDGTAVTFRNADWNGTLPAGGSVAFGFLGSGAGDQAVPGYFTLNDDVCTTG